MHRCTAHLLYSLSSEKCPRVVVLVERGEGEEIELEGGSEGWGAVTQFVVSGV